MIIEIALLASLLSEPKVTPDMLDMTYKPCVEAYNIYKDISEKDPTNGKLVGNNLLYLCAPIKQMRQDE
jgi:hypothetical protein